MARRSHFCQAAIKKYKDQIQMYEREIALVTSEERLHDENPDLKEKEDL
jgi:hypothetical protein